MEPRRQPRVHSRDCCGGGSGRPSRARPACIAGAKDLGSPPHQGGACAGLASELGDRTARLRQRPQGHIVPGVNTLPGHAVRPGAGIDAVRPSGSATGLKCGEGPPKALGGLGEIQPATHRIKCANAPVVRGTSVGPTQQRLREIARSARAAARPGRVLCLDPRSDRLQRLIKAIGQPSQQFTTLQGKPGHGAKSSRIWRGHSANLRRSCRRRVRLLPPRDGSSMPSRVRESSTG